MADAMRLSMSPEEKMKMDACMSQPTVRFKIAAWSEGWIMEITSPRNLFHDIDSYCRWQLHDDASHGTTKIPDPYKLRWSAGRWAEFSSFPAKSNLILTKVFSMYLNVISLMKKMADAFALEISDAFDSPLPDDYDFKETHIMYVADGQALIAVDVYESLFRKVWTLLFEMEMPSATAWNLLFLHGAIAVPFGMMSDTSDWPVPTKELPYLFEKVSPEDAFCPQRILAYIFDEADQTSW
jgi:hypothetical protein